MSTELLLRRKWTLRACGQQVIFVKKPNEHSRHVLMKAFLWALYLPDYRELSVEVPIGDRYKPDVVSLDREGIPKFWGEAGQVSVRKIRSLVKRYPDTHFAIAKWDSRLSPVVDIVQKALSNVQRTAPFDLLAFPANSGECFINADGNIHLKHDELDWVRLSP